MKYSLYDEAFNFYYYFDTKTGFYLRTDILDENGSSTGVDPFMASFPHLIDIGIMGSCEHGNSGLCKVQCYQSGGSVSRPNMALEDFERIISECRGKTVQVALGGRGDPNQHKHFEQMLEICSRNNIVPNYTTSGYKLTEKQVELTKEYCGAVAVSWYRTKYTAKAIELFRDAGCITNIHFVLNNETIDEAISILENNSLNIDAIIFLLYKPIGNGVFDKVLKLNDNRLQKFCSLINNSNFKFKVGFDSCTVPLLLNNCPNINPISLDTCEAARFSCYISSQMVMTPCSFDRYERYAVQLSDEVTIQDAWNHKAFNLFRRKFKSTCPNCEKRKECLGGCPLMKKIVLCHTRQRRKRKNENT